VVGIHEWRGLVLWLGVPLALAWSLLAAESPPAADKAPGVPAAAAVVAVQPGEVLANSIGMKLRLIQPGTFKMGSEKGYTDERPVHQVKITKPFYLGVCEVTQAEWQRVMGSNPSFVRGEKRPVENITWAEAREFCRKLTELEKRTYRLPTEAEWEYACRARTTTEYYWGDKFDAQYAWTHANSGKTTHDVGTRLPNAWGLFDMCGNVWEWCDDWKGDYSGGDQVDSRGPAQGGGHVARGGSWTNSPERCCSAYRFAFDPAVHSHNLGLRVVLDARK